jgi:hypothetical protein
MTIHVSKKKILVALAALALVITAVGIAAWLISANGDGRGKAGTLVAPTITPGDATNATPTFPGVPGSLSIQVDNPNGPLVITGWTMVSQNAVAVSGGSGSCTSADAFLLDSDTGITPIQVQSGTSTVQLPGAVMLKPSAPTGCQGATLQTTGNNIHVNFSTP